MQYNSQQQRRIIPTEYFTIPLPVSTVIGRADVRISGQAVREAWAPCHQEYYVSHVGTVSPSPAACLSRPVVLCCGQMIDAFKPIMWLYNLMTQVQLTTLSLLHILRRCKYHVQSGHGRAGLTHLFKIVRADKFLSQVSSL